MAERVFEYVFKTEIREELGEFLADNRRWSKHFERRIVDGKPQYVATAVGAKAWVVWSFGKASEPAILNGDYRAIHLMAKARLLVDRTPISQLLQRHPIKSPWDLSRGDRLTLALMFIKDRPEWESEVAIQPRPDLQDEVVMSHNAKQAYYLWATEKSLIHPLWAKILSDNAADEEAGIAPRWQ